MYYIWGLVTHRKIMVCYVSDQYLLGRGINGEGFNSKLAMVKMCSTWPLLNKYALSKIFEVGLQTPPLPQTAYRAYGKGQNLKIRILFLPWSKCIHINQKGIIIPFKQNSDMIYWPHGRVLSLKWLILSKMVIFVTFGHWGVLKTLQIFC